jgi:hypothetical protein
MYIGWPVELYDIEMEPEVRVWLEGLTVQHLARVDFMVGLLAEQAETLGEPYTRNLGGKTRELRFFLGSQQVRVTYWLAPRRRVILLTVFRKSRQKEMGEVERARLAQKICEAEHEEAHVDVFEPEVM